MACYTIMQRNKCCRKANLFLQECMQTTTNSDVFFLPSVFRCIYSKCMCVVLLQFAWGPWWDACTHRQLVIVAIAHYCLRDHSDPPGGVSSSDTATSARRQPLQALIGGMKYCRRKLKGPSVKIIHDMHIFPAWWNRWYLD